MDYNLGFALTFKCKFYYDFISIFVIGIQYMIHDAKYELKKNTKALTTNEYELLNDHIWAIFSKVQI
jgi:predicted porin